MSLIHKLLLFMPAWLPVFPHRLHAQQSLTLEQSYALAVQNYPAAKQRELIRRSGDYSLASISMNAVPQLAVSGQATYQSDVTQIPVKLPNLDIPLISKDQYRLYGEIVQPLTDLVTVKQQKNVQRSVTENEELALETELYKLKDRVNQLYFGILLLDEQTKQNALTRSDLQTGINRVSAALANGTELRSSVDKLRADMLRVDQKDIDLRAARRAYIDMLGLLTNQSLDEHVTLQNPAPATMADSVTRPELKEFAAQRKIYDARAKLLNTKNLPRFSVFFQGGIGRPALNMLSNDLKSYYIGGARLNWSISSFYTYKKERKLLELGKKMTDTREETFLLNTRSAMKQQQAEVYRLQELLRTDSAIVALRGSIKAASGAQLENGVITVNDYLREVNNDDMARQTASYHAVQLSMALYNYKTTTGN